MAQNPTLPNGALRIVLPLAWAAAALAAQAGIVLTSAPVWLLVGVLVAYLAPLWWYVLRIVFAAYRAPGMRLTLLDYEVLPEGARTTPASDDWARDVGTQLRTGRRLRCA